MSVIVDVLKKGLEYVAVGEYDRIKEENKTAREYGDFIHLMDDVTKERSAECKPNELSRDCPDEPFVMPQYHQEGRTTDGTAPLRIYTIAGSDGQIINVQGFDLSKKVLITVQHKDGTIDAEKLDPDEASKRIKREAGYPHHPTISTTK